MATAGCPVDWPAFLDELLQGKALTRELDTRLDGPFSADLCRSMVHGILASWERLISMTNPVKLEEPVVSCDDGTPQKALHHVSKKRKVLPTHTSRVRVSEVTGAGGDDGHSWRKYGQKRILGARNPRAYYRCTHKFTQNCEALKMVQRCEEDPSLLDVTYRGDHTCRTRHRTKLQGHAGLLQSFKEELRVKTEDLHDDHLCDLLESNSCAMESTPTPTTLESQVTGSSLSPFAGPATPESTLFVLPWCFEEIISRYQSPAFEDFDLDSMLKFDELMPNLESLLAD